MFFQTVCTSAVGHATIAYSTLYKPYSEALPALKYWWKLNVTALTKKNAIPGQMHWSHEWSHSQIVLEKFRQESQNHSWHCREKKLRTVSLVYGTMHNHNVNLDRISKAIFAKQTGWLESIRYYAHQQATRFLVGSQ